MKLLAALLAGVVALGGAAWGQPVESSCYVANQRVPCSNWIPIPPHGTSFDGSATIDLNLPTRCYFQGRQWISPTPGRCYAADAPQQEP